MLQVMNLNNLIIMEWLRLNQRNGYLGGDRYIDLDANHRRRVRKLWRSNGQRHLQFSKM